MTPVQAWGIRHHVSLEALAELRAILNLPGVAFPVPSAVRTEGDVQALVRLEAARKGVRLWRNNVGVTEGDATHRPVRYGLANDSAALNGRLKSSDLVGWRPLEITRDHVGSHVAQVVCREVKAPGWRYAGGPREEAQLAWLTLVLADGGDAAFATGEGTL